MKALWCVGLLALGSAQRTGVAPWDVPDLPPPDVVARPRPESPAILRAEGTRAVLPSGIAVEMLAVARRRWDPERRYKSPLPDAHPAWRPDGSPYLDTGPTERPFKNRLEYHATGGLMALSDEGRELDDHGARYLAFRLTGPPGSDADLDGYVPEDARHGRDVPSGTIPLHDGQADYETEIVVADRAATHYRLAVATGAWKAVADVPVAEPPAWPRPGTDAPLGKTVLARGPWGELWRDATALDRLRERMKRGGGSTGPWPRARYYVAPAETLAFATRLREFDAQGNEAVGRGTERRGRTLGESGRLQGPPVRIVVEARPHAWVEFSNVHYDPDRAKWPEAYWGAEGEKTLAHNEGTVLQAIVAPEIVGTQMVAARVYAPDGRLWRAFPRPLEVVPYWPDLASWGEQTDPAARLIASLRLNPGRTDGEERAWVAGFASTGNVPGQGLGAPLDPPRQFTARFKAMQYRFVPPATPYVQFSVRYALPWKKVAEFAPPTPGEIAAYAKDRAALDKKFGPFGVVAPHISPEGSADLKLVVGGESQTRKGVARWTSADPLELTRIVARMRDGARHPIGEMAFGKNAGYAFFTLDEQGRPFHQVHENSVWPKVRFLLSDVAAFEVEAQNYTGPTFVVAKLPSRG